jgi:hypothetical protein
VTETEALQAEIRNGYKNEREDKEMNRQRERCTARVGQRCPRVQHCTRHPCRHNTTRCQIQSAKLTNSTTESRRRKERRKLMQG